MGFDLTPWKVQICDRPVMVCLRPEVKVMISEMPDAPEPGRIPKGADHVHLVPRFSADQRGARDDHKWRGLVNTLLRCEHGRLHGDMCTQCPDGYSPDRTGQRIGTRYDGRPVVVPPRGKTLELDAWYGEA